MKQDYEVVIGLEVHAELSTETKIFCGCSTKFGAEPNTQCCPVCMGFPGTLPVLNEKVVEYAAKAGLATHCEIAEHSREDRKNYFYPDLPKAYQISQFDAPLCEHGWLELSTGKRVGITRIHIEEDAGKLTHTDEGTLCDYNRCGVPLIEIVSEPDLRSAEEAVEYLRKLRAILLYAGVSDCKMQEGSLRCDVNLSVHKPGEPFGTRSETKNLNSFTFMQKAIAFETARQIEAVESGDAVVQETRRFDVQSGKTFSMRSKEDADDYRYFPDPDLPPIRLRREQVEQWASEIPELPDARCARYVSEYGLSIQDASQIVSERESADWFEQAAAHGDPVTVSRLLVGEVFRLWEPESGPIPLPAEILGELAELLHSGRINSNTAKKTLGLLWEHPESPEALIGRENWWQIDDPEQLRAVASEVLQKNPKAVAQFLKGKQNAMQALVGQCMGATGGLANPVAVQSIVAELLREME